MPGTVDTTAQTDLAATVTLHGDAARAVLDAPSDSLDARILDEHAEAFAAIDALEVAMLSSPDFIPIDLPLEHRFTPGLYIRTIFMPAGTLLTSKIHKTEHPFCVTKGVVDVFDDDNGPVRITAPHMGVTKPGTRRVLRIIEDTVWTTYHPIGEMGIGDLAGLTEDEKVARIEGAIILKHDEHIAGLLQAKQRPALSTERADK
jgi:hypothetical protein